MCIRTVFIFGKHLKDGNYNKEANVELREMSGRFNTQRDARRII